MICHPDDLVSITGSIAYHSAPEEMGCACSLIIDGINRKYTHHIISMGHLIRKTPQFRHLDVAQIVAALDEYGSAKQTGSTWFHRPGEPYFYEPYETVSSLARNVGVSCLRCSEIFSYDNWDKTNYRDEYVNSLRDLLNRPLPYSSWYRVPLPVLCASCVMDFHRVLRKVKAPPFTPKPSEYNGRLMDVMVLDAFIRIYTPFKQKRRRKREQEN